MLGTEPEAPRRPTIPVSTLDKVLTTQLVIAWAPLLLASFLPALLSGSLPLLLIPLLVAVLAAAGQLEAGALASVGLVGELALDGRLRPVRGELRGVWGAEVGRAAGRDGGLTIRRMQ